MGFRNDLNLEFKVPAPFEERITARRALSSIPAYAGNQERIK